jgi:hypothetical protein
MHTIRNDSMKYDRHDEQKGGRGKAGLSMRGGEVHGAAARDGVSWIWVVMSKDLQGIHWVWPIFAVVAYRGGWK